MITSFTSRWMDVRCSAELGETVSRHMINLISMLWTIRKEASLAGLDSETPEDSLVSFREMPRK